MPSNSGSTENGGFVLINGELVFCSDYDKVREIISVAIDDFITISGLGTSLTFKNISGVSQDISCEDGIYIVNLTNFEITNRNDVSEKHKKLLSSCNLKMNAETQKAYDEFMNKEIVESFKIKKEKTITKSGSQESASD